MERRFHHLPQFPMKDFLGFATKTQKHEERRSSREEKKTSYRLHGKRICADLQKVVPRPFKEHEKYLINKH